MSPKLVVEQGPLKGNVFHVAAAPMVLGRGTDAEAPLEDDRASRHHAEIVLDGQRRVIRDLGSKNGTYVNGKRLTGDLPLRSGDRILVGMTVLVYDPAGASSVEFLKNTPNMEETSFAKLAFDDEEDGEGHPDATIRAEEFDELDDPGARLKLLYRYGHVLGRCFDQQVIVEHLLDAIFRVAKPDRGVVFLRDLKTGELTPAASRSLAKTKAPDGSDAKILVSHTILERCVAERALITVRDAMNDQRFSAAQSILSFDILSALCCPLFSGEEIHGALYIDTVGRFREFSEAQIELVTGIANQGAMAIGNALRHQQELEHREIEMQLEVARRIHDRLLPKHGFANEAFEGCGWNRPCSAVGGDYYGFHQHESDQLVAIGDSSGHGVGAALLMSSARAYLVGTLTATDPPLGKMMTTLNRLVQQDTDDCQFISFLLASFEAPTRRMRYVSAGHEPPLLYRASEDRFIDLGVTGIVLGIMDDCEYAEEPSVFLQPNDLVLFFTDGILEQRNPDGEEFQEQRLRETLRGCAHGTPKEIIEAISSRVDEWRGAILQEDDHTLVCVKAK